MIVQSGINQGKRVVQRSGRWIDTTEISSYLGSKFPHMEFPFLQEDHVAGVASNVHAFCNKHQQFTKMSISSVRSGGTRYACITCAVEQQMLDPKKVIRYTRNPMTPVGVESGIFRAIKAEFPDAYLWHKMSNGKEIDIFIPSLNAGVEYNGNYWHSTAIKEDKNYHLDKTEFAVIQHGAKIFHVLTEEALADNNYQGLLHQFRLLKTEKLRDLIVDKSYKVKPLIKRFALEFHQSYNYLYSACLKQYEDNFGVWADSELVAVLSGSVKEKFVFSYSVKHSWVDIFKCLEHCKKFFGGTITLKVELNNPNAYYSLWMFGIRSEFSKFNRLTWERLSDSSIFDSRSGNCRKGLTYFKLCAPDFYPLDKNYKIDLTLSESEVKAKIYDCGSFLLSLN